MLSVSDPQTVWLTLTNIILGLVTLACVVLVIKAIIGEARARRGRKASAAEDHAYAVEGLGLTMADGGERVPPQKI